MNTNQENNTEQNKSETPPNTISELNKIIELQQAQLEQQKKSSNWGRKVVFTFIMVFFIIPVVVNSCVAMLNQ